MAKRRRVRGATEQRKITLPLHEWELLDWIAELHTDAYRVNGGKTRFTASDGVESGVELLAHSLRDDIGPLPTAESSKAEREAWVKKLGEQMRKDLMEQFWAKKTH
jgi:hypothetical protein